MSRVRTMSSHLMEKPQYFNLNTGRAKEVANLLADRELSIPDWRSSFKGLDPSIDLDDFEQMSKFFLIFNSINYCYFDHYGHKFSNKGVSGSALALACINNNWQYLDDPSFLASVDENYLLGELFRAENPISLVKERAHALREIGDFLIRNTDFTFDKYFRKFRQDAYFASQALPTFLPSWREPFYKRSQLFVGMVYGTFQNWEELPITKESINNLTIFADYRVPQALISLGIVEPTPEIGCIIEADAFVPKETNVELEIRAASILGADLLMNALREVRNDRGINSLHIDYLLWSMGRGVFAGSPDSAKLFPRGWFSHHHRTVTTDY